MMLMAEMLKPLDGTGDSLFVLQGDDRSLSNTARNPEVMAAFEAAEIVMDETALWAALA
jgi:hypothetical protein